MNILSGTCRLRVCSLCVLTTVLSLCALRLITSVQFYKGTYATKFRKGTYLYESTPDAEEQDVGKCDRNGSVTWSSGELEKIWAMSLSSITRHHLYPENSDWRSILNALGTAPILEARLFSSEEQNISRMLDSDFDYGSTHKWLLRLEGNQFAIFKPQW